MESTGPGASTVTRATNAASPSTAEAFDGIVEGLGLAPAHESGVADVGEGPTAAKVFSLVIPMFKESARIEATVATLAASTLNRFKMEFVFVDDGSADGTAAATEAAIAAHGLRDARVVRLAANLGKGGAVRAGVLASSGAHVGFVDADLSLDPAEVSRSLARLMASTADLVVGYRIVNEATQPPLRRLASRIFTRVVAHLMPTDARDTQCAMKVFRGPVALELFAPLATMGFAFDVEILARARRSGYLVDEVPVRWQHQPGSRLNTGTAGVAMVREVLAVRRSLR